MNTTEKLTTGQPERDFATRANRIVDYREAVAEGEALFNNNAVEVAGSLQQFLKTRLNAEGKRAGDGVSIPDSEREDGPGTLSIKRAYIDALELTPMGTITEEGLEVVEDFRQHTREAVELVANGDTDWVRQGVSEERADAKIAKYQAFAQQLADQPQ